MRFYLDTEFNGHRGELISLALVSEPMQIPMAQPGQVQHIEFYQARHIKSTPNDWVREHVIPVLRTPLLPPARFKQHFHDFIVKYPHCEVICDWHADAEYFCSLLDGHDYGSSLDLPCVVRIIKTPSEGGPVSATPHNALEDARALCEWYEALLRAS